MAIVFTFVMGLLGGVVAFYLQLPIPWLIGSMLIAYFGSKLIRPPGKRTFRWMRILLGVTVGSSVSADLSNQVSLLAATSMASIFLVLSVTFLGYYYFSRLHNFSPTDRFISALPGGLTFILSISDNLGNNFPKIALIHAIRLFILISCFSIFGYFVGDAINTETIFSAFELNWSTDLWMLIPLILLSSFVADKIGISGGHLIFPIVISALAYHLGFIEVPVPELIKTIAMIAFGVQIGYKLAGGSVQEYKEQAKASAWFSGIAIVLALGLALILSQFHSVHYFLIFLALAPGSIPEISLIALALGFDVGFVAMIHTCRYFFILCLGWLGITFFENQEKIPFARYLPKKGSATG